MIVRQGIISKKLTKQHVFYNKKGHEAHSLTIERPSYLLQVPYLDDKDTIIMPRTQLKCWSESEFIPKSQTHNSMNV